MKVVLRLTWLTWLKWQMAESETPMSAPTPWHWALLPTERPIKSKAFMATITRLRRGMERCA